MFRLVDMLFDEKAQQGKKKDRRFRQASARVAADQSKGCICGQKPKPPRGRLRSFGKHPRILFSASLLPGIFIRTLSLRRPALRLPQPGLTSCRGHIARQVLLAPTTQATFAKHHKHAPSYGRRIQDGLREARQLHWKIPHKFVDRHGARQGRKGFEICFPCSRIKSLLRARGHGKPGHICSQR